MSVNRGTTPVSYANTTVTGTVTNLNDVVTLNATGLGDYSASVTGTWTGTISVEATSDGTNWSPLSAVVQGGVGTLLTTITANAQVRGTIGGLAQMRLRLSTVGSGIATITITGSCATAGVFLVAPVPLASPTRAQTARSSVGITAVQLDTSPLAKRRAVEVRYNSGGATAGAFIYVGFTSGVTTATGREVIAGESARFDITEAVNVWVIATVAGQPVQLTELGE